MPPTRVDPEREMPGKIAKAWKKPIQKASFAEISSRERLRLPTFSAPNSNPAVTNKNKAEASGLSNALSTNSLTASPIKPAGMLARMRYHPRRARGSENGFPLNVFARSAWRIDRKSFQKYAKTANKIGRASCRERG